MSVQPDGADGRKKEEAGRGVWFHAGARGQLLLCSLLLLSVNSCHPVCPTDRLSPKRPKVIPDTILIRIIKALVVRVLICCSQTTHTHTRERLSIDKQKVRTSQSTRKQTCRMILVGGGLFSPHHTSVEHLFTHCRERDNITRAPSLIQAIKQKWQSTSSPSSRSRSSSSSHSSVDPANAKGTETPPDAAGAEADK